MANDIVIVQVSQTQAPLPNNLQKKGAFISQGGTTLDAGSYSILTAVGDLADITAGGKAVTTMTWSTAVVTVTTTTPHGWMNGDTVEIVVTGVTPTGYNGTYAATITGASTLTYPLVSNPGVVTVQGVVTDEDVTELNQMNTTFWAQGNSVPAYVLELGASEGTPAEGIVALNTWIEDNPEVFYLYLTPRAWGSDSTFPAFAANYNATTAKTYFFATTTLAAMLAAAGSKAVVEEVESTTPVLPATEFSLAAFLWQALSTNPSNTNRVAPFAFRYQVGVTAGTWTGPQQVAFKTGSVNYITTGAEGGISNKIIKYGTNMDGRGFGYWYAVDWAAINLKLDLANEIINGSNNPINPLYYNQDGINRLKAKAQNTMNRGVAFGLFLAPVKVEAVDFLTYTNDNPSDYRLGIYNGLSCSAVVQNGFTQITFNLNVTDFVTT